MKKRVAIGQVTAVKQMELGTPVANLCCNHPEFQ